MPGAANPASIPEVNILVLTVSAPPFVASTQFRFEQFQKPLREKGISLTLVPANEPSVWPDLTAYDLVIVQKRLMRTSRVKRVRKAAKKLIFDTDDAIWEPHGKKHSLWTRIRTHARVKAIAGAADACTVPNEHLAAHLRGISGNVGWIPMALDENLWHPPAERLSGPLRIGWAGAPPNLTYLTELSDALHEVQALRPGTEIIIYCGKLPEWKKAVESIHHPFSPGTEAEVVRTFDIGLLPLPDDPFAAGKSPIKALQYAACGVPCIASPVGATREIVKNGMTGLTATTPAEWREAMLRLIDDAEERKKLGEAARRMFLENHTRAQVQERMIAFWKSVAG